MQHKNSIVMFSPWWGVVVQKRPFSSMYKVQWTNDCYSSNALCSFQSMADLWEEECYPKERAVVQLKSEGNPASESFWYDEGINTFTTSGYVIFVFRDSFNCQINDDKTNEKLYLRCIIYWYHTKTSFSKMCSFYWINGYL